MQNKGLLAGVMMGFWIFSTSALAAGNPYDWEHDPDHEKLKQHELNILKQYSSEAQVQADALYNIDPKNTPKLNIIKNQDTWYKNIEKTCYELSAGRFPALSATQDY